MVQDGCMSSGYEMSPVLGNNFSSCCRGVPYRKITIGCYERCMLWYISSVWSEVDQQVKILWCSPSGIHSAELSTQLGASVQMEGPKQPGVRNCKEKKIKDDSQLSS